MTRQLVVGLALAIVAGGTPRAGQQVRDAVPAPAASSPRGTATISGTVFVAGQGRQPARRVRVTLNDIDRRAPGQTTTTDDAGAFRFAGVSAGRFELETFRNGFLRGSFGASRPERPGVPVIVRDGDAVEGLVLTIAHGGVIAGVVRDRKGQPVPGVEVRVLRLGYSQTTGEPVLSVPAGSLVNGTDDRGEYRAFGLPPGGYVVLATPGPGRGYRGYGEPIRVLTSAEVQRAMQSARAGGPAPPPAAPVNQPRFVTYTPVFHPDVTDISRAITVPLRVGEERSDVDITIELVPTSTISGRLTSPNGQWPVGLVVTVTPNGPSAGMLAGAGLGVGAMVATPKADHTYSIGGVMPGSYTVKAGNSTGSARGGAPVVDGQTLSGAADITVDGRDIDVPITLTPGVPIAGHVTFAGVAPAPAEVQTMSFQLVPVGSGGAVFRTAGGRVDANGDFTFASVPPDAYYLFPAWTDTRWAITSVIANGRDAFEAPLRITAGRPVDLRVAFTDKPSVLKGVFQDRGGRPATDYFVLVFSADRTFWAPASRRIRTTRPATDGTFDVRGLPPGDYLLAALTDLEPGEWNDPTLLADLARAAIKVTLREGQTATQDVRLGGG